MSNFPAFFTELLKRFGLETPRFFKIIQMVGAAATFIGFIPKILVALDITPTDVFSHYLQILLKVAGFTAIIVAKLPANNANAVISSSNKMPFSENAKATGTDKSVAETIAKEQTRPVISVYSAPKDSQIKNQ